MIRMAHEKTRYKAVIADQTYTIIGRETKHHMDIVTNLINEQLKELKDLSPQIDNEQAAILMAVNALSDQLKKQERNLELEKEVADLKKNRKGTYAHSSALKDRKYYQNNGKGQQNRAVPEQKKSFWQKIKSFFGR